MSHADARTPWRQTVEEVWGSFRRGLTVPSMLSTILCLGLAASYLGSLFGLVNETVMLRYGDRFLAEDDTDYDYFVTRETIRMKRASVDTPVLVITGASTTRCALLQPDLEEAYGIRGEQLPRLFKLCGSGQPVVGSVALWDVIPDGARGFLVVGVSPGTLWHGTTQLVDDYRDGRLGMNTPQLFDILAREGQPLPFRTGIYGLDHARFLLSRGTLPLKRATQGFTPLVQAESYHNKEPLDAKDRAKVVKRLTAQLSLVRPEETIDDLHTLRTGIQKLRGRTSLEIIFLETPVSSACVEKGQLRPMFERVNAQVAELAKELGASYVNLNTELSIPDSAFHDMVHVRDPEWTARCAQCVVDRMVDPTRVGVGGPQSSQARAQAGLATTGRSD